MKKKKRGGGPPQGGHGAIEGLVRSRHPESRQSADRPTCWRCSSAGGTGPRRAGKQPPARLAELKIAPPASLWEFKYEGRIQCQSQLKRIALLTLRRWQHDLVIGLWMSKPVRAGSGVAAESCACWWPATGAGAME